MMGKRRTYLSKCKVRRARGSGKEVHDSCYLRGRDLVAMMGRGARFLSSKGRGL